MAVRIWISDITFSDNTTLRFEKDDVIVFVGPNNAGKSASLKESAALLKSKAKKGKVLKDITIEKQGEGSELFVLLDEHTTKNYDSPGQIYYQGLNIGVWESNVRSIISNYPRGIGNLTPLFVNILTTEQRLLAANPAQNIKLTTQAIQHPIHYLQKDDSLEERFSNYFRQAFGTDLIVHRNAGS
ncbi:MAG: hypothetical protein AAGE93_14030 [Bacteroidota bacterium]